MSQNNMFCEQLIKLKSIVEKNHYAPKPINDSLSKHVHQLFINSINNDKRLLVLSDINAFQSDKYQIDDYIKSNNCDFINKYIDVLTKRIDSIKIFISELKSVPLNYSGKDSVHFDSDSKFDYLKNTHELKEYWNKRIRFNILTKLIENDSVIEHINKNFNELESQLKPKIIQNELCLLDELLNQNGGIDQFVKDSFLNAFLNYQDPHSIYLNTPDKFQFENNIANSQLSFGITTSKNDDGEIFIAHVVPGSSAFLNENIETNDVIKSMISKNDVLEAYCLSNDDVMDYLNEADRKTIVFKIKKSNGQVLDIELTKTNIEIETNTIRGYIIKGSNTIGYVNVPSFYTDMESVNGLGVANDLAKELYKLKKENIQGLIIDLRFNGGGSMKEAADLSGMFINRGPVTFVKNSKGNIYAINDTNNGYSFVNPIVVLVNEFSASASEFFASVMQDYNRAVIVGATTHGKSTAQVILPIDENKDLGFTKITTEKFYRPNGKSIQSIGVKPDVVIPSIYDNFETQEQYSPFALQNDSITPTNKFIPENPINFDKLKLLSNTRIDTSLYFNSIKKMNSELLKSYKHKKITYALTLESVHNDLNNYLTLWKWFGDIISKNKTHLTIENTSSTLQLLQHNRYESEINNVVIEDLTNDIELNEAYSIIIDLINP